jgi:tetratricopeptide (TPR) repeat protein
MLIADFLLAVLYRYVLNSSKQPPVKTGGIAVFRLCLSAFGGYFHPPIKIGGIEIGRIKMSITALIKLLKEIEKNFDVNSLYYKDLRIWPLIRSQLRMQIGTPEVLMPPKKAANENFCNSILPQPQQLAELTPYKNVDFMFISRSGEYKYGVKIDGKLYNIWIDPYIETIKDTNSFLKVESSSNQDTLPRYIPPVFLKTVHSNFYYPTGKGWITNFEQLGKYVLSISGIDLDEQIIIEKANDIEQYRLYYLELLSQIQPKAVLMVCYYCTSMMGLIWACRDLNITSVDLQHGYQTNHILYQNILQIPCDGYKLLPDIFYVWGPSFKEGNEKNQSAGCSRHYAVIGNNAWMRKAIQDKPIIDEIDEAFFEHLKQKKKVVLITIEPEHFGLPAHVFEAMKYLPKDWLWLIRSRPHRPIPQELIEVFHSYGIRNYEIEKTTRYPLFLILKYCHHHLTDFSTVSFECLLYGVPTTFYYPKGYEYLKEYVDRGFFNYVPCSTEDLMQSLSAEYNKERLKMLSKHFFEMDKLVGKKAFEEILNYSKSRKFQPLTDNYRAQNYMWAGKELFRYGELNKAFYSFLNVTKACPNNVDAYNNLGTVCWNMGKVEDAVRCIKMALKINPVDENALRNYQQLRMVKDRMPPGFNDLLSSIKQQLINSQQNIYL